MTERKKINKVEKLVCSIEDKEKYVIHIRVLKQALNHSLVLWKVRRVIQKKCIIKPELMFENYKDCLFNDGAILKSQQRFKRNHHKVCTEEVNKIPLSSDDDKRL